MLARLGLMIAIGAMMAAAALASIMRSGSRAALVWAWRWLTRVLSVFAALIVLFAEWGWRPLAALLGQLRHLALVARFEAWLQTLPPYGALAAFLLPSLLLLPLKLMALYLIVHGHKLVALGLIALAKLGGTAIVARLFILTSPQLLRIGWFARLHDQIMPWKHALFEQIRVSWAWRYGRMLKSRVKQLARRAWMRGRPVVARLVALAQFQLRSLFRRA